MREGEPVFVDTGAWIALALSRDPLHARAVELWESLQGDGVRLHTSVAILLETFTFLDRNATRDVSLAWKDSLAKVGGLRVLPAYLRLRVPAIVPPDLSLSPPYRAPVHRDGTLVRAYESLVRPGE